MAKASARRGTGTSRTPFRRILVPTDLTDRTHQALELTFELAGSGTRVTLLHVVQTVPGLAFDDLRPAYEKLRDRAARKMATIVNRVTPSALGVEIKIAYGPRAETIVKTATRDARRPHRARLTPGQSLNGRTRLGDDQL